MLGRMMIEVATRDLPRDEIQRRRATEWALELRRRHPGEERVQEICLEILRVIEEYEDGRHDLPDPSRRIRDLFLELSDLGRL